MKIFNTAQIVQGFENAKDSLNKRGMSPKVTGLISALILIVLAVALAPTMFYNLNATGLGTNSPSWLATVLPIIVAAGLVFIIWRAFND